jgi:large subunit ribosomal protein L21
MKYAVFESGGKQYVARPGERIEVDRLEAEPGDVVDMPAVLLAVDGSAILVGRPRVEGARVTATVEGQVKGPKIVVYRYIPKERYRRKRGHRQVYTSLRIDEVVVPGGSAEAPSDEATVAEPPAKKSRAASKADAAGKTRGPAAQKKPAAKKPAARKKKAE